MEGGNSNQCTVSHQTEQQGVVTNFVHITNIEEDYNMVDVTIIQL